MNQGRLRPDGGTRHDNGGRVSSLKTAHSLVIATSFPWHGHPVQSQLAPISGQVELVGGDMGGWSV